jgi:hypothetical protein
MRTLFFQNAPTGPEPDSIVPVHSDKFFWDMSDTLFTPRAVKLVARVHGRSMRSTGTHGEVLPLKMTLILPAATLDATESGYENIPIHDEALKGMRQLTPAEAIVVRVENPTDTAWDARVVVTGEWSLDGSHLGETLIGLRPRRDESNSRRLRVPAGGSTNASLQFPWACSPRRITMRSDSQLDVVMQSAQVCNVSLFMGGAIPVEVFDGGLDIKTVNATPANRMTVSLHNSGDSDRYVEIDVDVDAPHVRAHGDRMRGAVKIGDQQHGGPQAPR